MHRPTGEPTVARTARARWRQAVGVWAALLATGACTHRSIAEVGGEVPLTTASGGAVERIRIEVDNGTIDIGPPDPEAPSAALVYRGAVRRDATDAAGLARIEAVPVELVATADPDRPGTLVLRGPKAPADVTGMIAFEAGIRLPTDVAVEVEVRHNGHINVIGRRAPVEARTGRGDLHFEDCSGGVRGSTRQGVLIAYDHRGDLDVRTDLGDMQAFVAEPGAVLTLSTGKGTVQCLVPAEAGFTADARVEIGRIGNDFGLPVQKVGDYSAAMTGVYGDGRTRLILRTASGHVALRRWQQEDS